MKRLLVVLLAGLVAALAGCDDSNPSDASGEATVIYAFAFHGDFLAEREEATDLWGLIAADPIPAFESVTMNGIEFSGHEHWDFSEGLLYFGGCVIYSDFDPLTVEVSTSLGDVVGTEPLPVQPTGIAYSDPDSLGIGEDFTVFWSGGNGDFYFFELEYFHEYGVGSLDTLVVGTSVTIDGSFFPYNGEISEVYIQPINGPVLEPGSYGNMTGDGTGFLYHISDGEWEDVGIKVGNGLPWRAERPAKPGPDARRKRVARAILEANALPADLAR